MNPKRTLELLDWLEELGFTDEAFARLHRSGVENRGDRIAAHREDCKRTASFHDDDENMRVQRRLELVLRAYHSGGFRSNDPRVFVALADAAFHEIPPMAAATNSVLGQTLGGRGRLERPAAGIGERFVRFANAVAALEGVNPRDVVLMGHGNPAGALLEREGISMDYAFVQPARAHDARSASGMRPARLVAVAVGGVFHSIYGIRGAAQKEAPHALAASALQRFRLPTRKSAAPAELAQPGEPDPSPQEGAACGPREP